MTEQATKTRHVRVSVARYLIDVVLVGLTILLIPGVSVRFGDKWYGILIIAFVYGVLVQFVRPLLNLVFLPYLVQTYGLALALVDAVLFGILMLLFGTDVQVLDVLWVLIAGALLGVFRLGAEGVFGLTPPIGMHLSTMSGDQAPGRLAQTSPVAADRLRLLRIRRALLRHGLDALFDRGMIRGFRQRMQRFLWQPDFELSSISPAVRFRLLLQDLGPTYVKIGQIISSRARMLPDDWQLELERLQSDAPEFGFQHVEERIVEELGDTPTELYATFDRTPLAAASLAQVHRATLHSGENVAVKVQRPNIQTQLKSDVELLVKVSEALSSRAGWAQGIDLAGIVGEFGSTLLRELDYTIEAYNARRLTEVLAPIDGVRVPTVYHDLSSSGVLTLEFIPGVKSTNHTAILDAGIDPEVLAERTIQAAVKMLVFDGFFHADPHPGNVFVDLESGDLTMLDTGMIGELSVADRIKLAGLAQAIDAGDVAGMAQSLKGLSTPYRETDDEAYYDEAKRRITPFLNPPPGERIDVTGRVLPAAMSILREAGYRVDPNFTLAIKSLTQAEAITTSLVPAWSGTEFMRRALQAGDEIAEEHVTLDLLRDAAVRNASFVARELAQELPSIQTGARSWIDTLKSGGVTVNLDSSSFDTQVNSLRRTAHIVTLGILAAGLLIGSALAAGVGSLEGSVLAPVTGLALVIFTITSIGGVVALIVGSYRLMKKRT